MGVWLNIDKPTKKCTLHTEDCCAWVIRQEETPLKGWGSLRRDGGWLSFNDAAQAREYSRTEYPNYTIGTCKLFP